MATSPNQALPGDTLSATRAAGQSIAATPWSRFWARFLDINIWGIPAAIFLYMLIPQEVWNVLQLESAGYLFYLALTPFIIIFDAICISIFRQSPGKAILGIRLTKQDGAGLTFFDVVKRDFSLFLRGFGLGIPVLVLITLIWSFVRVKGGHQTSWDRKCRTAVIREGACFERTAIIAFLFFAFFAFMLFMKIYETGL
jgi:uncharacterized RDD family membrane protein YckC